MNSPESFRSLVDYLERSAARFPERVAVVGPDGTSMTYRQLDEVADRLAGFLVACGVRPGDRVGLLLPKTEKTVAALFGIMKARAAYVPADVAGPADRCASIYADCEVAALFLDAGRADVLAAMRVPPNVVWVGEGERPAGAVSFEKAAAHVPLVPDPASRSSQDLAYILYTSGSTGVPKGVMLTHENALAFVEWCAGEFSLEPGDRFSSHAPFHFDLSVFDLYASLRTGGALHLISEELGKDPRKLAHFIAERELTVWYSTPSILSLLAEFGGLEGLDCSAVKLVLFAGEVFPVKKLRNLLQLWPHPAYYNLYGPTETNVCNYYKIPATIPEERTDPYPIGPVCNHCEPLVLDEAGQRVPQGGEGLLHIRGPSVFQGYWNRPELNARVFLQQEGKRWYNTGDVVREDPTDGFLYVGRRDRMVKRRGYRIELGEIESVLYRHEQVREAAVVAVPDPAAGVKIVAHLAAQGEPRPSIIGLKRFCSENLLAYMSPDVFRFHEALPRTSTDKVDYQSLLRMQ